MERLSYLRTIQRKGVADLRRGNDLPVPHTAWLWFDRPTNGHKPPDMAPATIREQLDLPKPWCYRLTGSASWDRSAKHFSTWPRPETLRELEMIQDAPLERTR